jgi:hypothetical protein
MKRGITGRLQEAKLRRLDKSLIEGRPLHKPLAEKARKLQALTRLSSRFLARSGLAVACSLHSLRGSRTAHSWNEEGPNYLPLRSEGP